MKDVEELPESGHLHIHHQHGVRQKNNVGVEEYLHYAVEIHFLYAKS